MIVVYTNWMPARFSGYTIGVLILIRPAKKNDIGLLAHEKEHVRQFLDPRWWVKPAVEWEVAAYKVQAACYPDDRIPLFAKYLSTKYGFGLTVEEAERRLRA